VSAREPIIKEDNLVTLLCIGIVSSESFDIIPTYSRWIGDDLAIDWLIVVTLSI
jgi:hypothetical protein